jgi:hypothetical protein
MSHNHLFQQTDISHNIEQYDHVQIIGKDEYKGYIGCVTGIYNNPTLSEPLYIVELQATGNIIQRPKNRLKPLYTFKNNN